MTDELSIIQHLADSIVTLKPYMNAFIVKYDKEKDIFFGMAVGGDQDFIKAGEKITGKTVKDIRIEGKKLKLYKRALKKNDLLVHKDKKEIEDILFRLTGVPRTAVKLLVKAIRLKVAFTVPLYWMDLEGKRQPYGILGISGRRSEYSELDLELIRTLSLHSTQVLSNVRLINDLQKEQDLSRTLIDLMTHDISNCIQMSYLSYTNMKTTGKRPKAEDIDSMLSNLESNIRVLKNVKRLSITKSSGAQLFPQDLKVSIRQVKKILISENPNRNIEFELDLDDEIYIYCDDFVQDIWLNIFRNILKFDRSKKCIIKVDWDIAIRSQGTNVIVRIIDHGPGIPDEDKPLVFGREHRGRTKAKGYGLGLFVVSRLMEYYGGNVWIEDRLEGDHTKGTVFCLEFTTPQE